MIPTLNPGRQIEDVLSAIYEQRGGAAFEVVIVDSGSCSDDLARMRRFPAQLHQIRPSEFRHGRTRNLLGQLSRGEALLYLSQDARPASPDWMATLLHALAAPNVGGVYARQVPHADADPFIRYFLDVTYGPRATRRRLRCADRVHIDDIFFSNVSSALRREVWTQVPFRDDVLMSEDQYWAYDALRAGYEVVYEPAAQVLHSHNYSLRSLYARNWLSGASLRGLITDSRPAVLRRGLLYVLREAAWLIRAGVPEALPYMLAYEATRSAGFAFGSAGVFAPINRP
ncbi:MAG: glycosyltransferase [Chloroflexi bacterium]|nr:glycosyltransferase [Chloroflexota bacterium]